MPTPPSLPSVHTQAPPLKATDDVPSGCIFITVMMSAPAKRPATRVTSAPVSVATAILPKSARQPAHDQGATTGGTQNRGERERVVGVIHKVSLSCFV